MIIYGLDSLKGINHSSTYNNRRSVTDFIHTISQQISNETTFEINSAKFCSLTMDGSTDNSAKEQETLYVRSLYSVFIFMITFFVDFYQVCFPDQLNMFWSGRVSDLPVQMSSTDFYISPRLVVGAWVLKGGFFLEESICANTLQESVCVSGG